jgi:diguanylate cyclase (GGDEF)-like protein
MPLQGWLDMFNDIYYVSQNYERSRFQIFSHLVEVVGGLTQASTKLRDYDKSKQFLAKTFAWYTALLTAASLEDLDQIVWEKFPRICPYCRSAQCRCHEYETKPRIEPSAVRSTALRNTASRPRDLYAWQQMFEDIYDQSGRRRHGGEISVADAQDELLQKFGRLVEELGEVSEALRLAYFYPYHLRNEAADFFAWLCAVANALPGAFGRSEVLYLADAAWTEYPNLCISCMNAVCTCRPEPVRQAISRAGVYASEGRDELTGLWSRGRFDFDFPRIARAPRGGSVALLLIDCDDFKRFNDETPGGHEQGDALLRAVGEAISATVPHGSLAYRRGGDEFIVLVQGDDAALIEDIAGQIEAAVLELAVADVTGTETTYSLSVSVGVAVGGPDHEANLQLHTEADQDMYRRKRAKDRRVKERRSSG